MISTKLVSAWSFAASTDVAESDNAAALQVQVRMGNSQETHMSVLHLPAAGGFQPKPGMGQPGQGLGQQGQFGQPGGMPPQQGQFGQPGQQGGMQQGMGGGPGEQACSPKCRRCYLAMCSAAGHARGPHLSLQDHLKPATARGAGWQVRLHCLLCEPTIAKVAGGPSEDTPACSQPRCCRPLSALHGLSPTLHVQPVQRIGATNSR